MLVESVKAGKDEREPYPSLEIHTPPTPTAKQPRQRSTVNPSLPRIFSSSDRRPCFLLMAPSMAEPCHPCAFRPNPPLFEYSILASTLTRGYSSSISPY